LSFIFIVNSLSTNEDPRNGGILPDNEGGRWVPPVFARGFYRQNPGSVYRWNGGHITRLDGYAWHHMPIPADARNEAASGIVADPNRYPLERYSAATVFFANPFMKYRTATGDATARDLYQEGEIWHHLRFHHVGLYRNISYVDHAGSEDYVAGASSMCPWHKQLIPQAYESQDEDERFLSGGLAGKLSLLIALVAFSCSADELDIVLLRDGAWRNRNWIRHDRRTGSGCFFFFLSPLFFPDPMHLVVIHHPLPTSFLTNTVSSNIPRTILATTASSSHVPSILFPSFLAFLYQSIITFPLILFSKPPPNPQALTSPVLQNRKRKKRHGRPRLSRPG